MEWFLEPVLVPKRLVGLITAFYIVGVCGACSVLLDLDHVLVCVAKGIPITWENLARHAGRPLHLAAVAVVGGVFLACHARYYRLLARGDEVTRKIVKVR